MFVQCGNRQLDLSSPHVMGVLNVTPDSFFDGGRYLSLDVALHRVKQMIEEGASIIDIGGESTRPFSQPVSAQEEMDRIMPLVEKCLREFNVIISVDTQKKEVMETAITAGVHIINDVRALCDESALALTAQSNVAVCLMHMQANPQTMQLKPHYDDVVTDVYHFLQARVEACLTSGFSRNRIMVDPGFGFGKTPSQNLCLLKQLDRFCSLQIPVLIGVSRKATIGIVLNQEVDDRLYGSLAAAVFAISKGAKIIRAHDIKPTVQAINMINAVLQE